MTKLLQKTALNHAKIGFKFLFIELLNLGLIINFNSNRSV